MQFKNDLTFGEKYQYELLKILKPINYKMMEGNFKEYDLVINDDLMSIYYEVKADRIAYKFNQFCIEYEYNNKASGIKTTRSDFYAYFIVYPNNQYDLYIIPVREILDVIKNKKFSTIKQGGDRGASKFYIMDFDLFKNYKKNLESIK
jgi:hypothetical protein